MTPAADAPPGRRPPLTAFLELLALTGFAVAQPVLDVFGRSPEQFAFRGASDAVIIAFGFIVALTPAIGLFAAELVVGLVAGGAGPPAGRAEALLPEPDRRLRCDPR